MHRPEWWEQVVARVDAYRLDNPSNLPGAVFGVETEGDGRLVGNVGAEWSHDTICEIGSMTKPFNAAAVLLALEERGLLDVERPVYQLPGMAAYADHPVKRQIKLRHLLQHTSGLPSFQLYSEAPAAPCNDPRGGPPSGAELDAGPTTPWVGSPGHTNECVFADGRCRPARLVDVEQVSSYVMRTYAPPESPPPGAQYSYSTLNHVVTARIVEQLSGQSFNIYVKERLFGPLGMSDSFFVAQPTGDPAVDARIDEGVTEEQRGRIAELTILTQDGKLPPDLAPGPDGHWDKFRRGWRYVFPDSGMYSTANDLLAFLSMLRDGGVSGARRVLSPAIVSLLVDDQGFGHTMGFRYTDASSRHGPSACLLDHFGNKMTYFWIDRRAGSQALGVFLSQRMPNLVVNTNMEDGMNVIFRVFLPYVNKGAHAPQPVRQS
jgi:CubicO group peptidase (beta-lactamase class C family)